LPSSSSSPLFSSSFSSYSVSNPESSSPASSLALRAANCAPGRSARSGAALPLTIGTACGGSSSLLSPYSLPSSPY